MDNELNSDDRRQVEEFVQRHPDLKEELDILLLSKFSPDTDIVFEKKEELLMQPDASSINISNYDEWLVMYIDNELNAIQRKQVEQFVALNPSIKYELSILQKTKLQPEPEIIFPDKDSLNRRTEKVRVVYFNLRRIAVAAVLLLTVGITALVLYNKKSADNGEAVVSNSGKDQKNTINPVTSNIEKNENVKQPVINNSQQTLAQTTGKKPGGIKLKSTENKKQRVDISVKEKKEDPLLVENKNQKSSNNLPRPLIDVNTNKNENKESFVTDNNNSPKKENPLTNKPVTHTADKPLYASNPTVNDEDLNQSGGKKSKLRGFFRKLTRTFEKNTNIDATDDDRLLIGGLAIKLK